MGEPLLPYFSLFALSCFTKEIHDHSKIQIIIRLSDVNQVQDASLIQTFLPTL